MHPQESEIYLKAWKEKEKRTEYRLASLSLIIAQSQGVKISNRKPKIDDFLPEYAKEKNQMTAQQKEKSLKNTFMMMAKHIN